MITLPRTINMGGGGGGGGDEAEHYCISMLFKDQKKESSVAKPKDPEMFWYYEVFCVIHEGEYLVNSNPPLAGVATLGNSCI